MLAEISCISVSQTALAMPMVFADAPASSHGDSEDRPRPLPSASRLSDNAAATNAPPRTAPQETADAADSLATFKPYAGRPTTAAWTGSFMISPQKSAAGLPRVA